MFFLIICSAVFSKIDSTCGKLNGTKNLSRITYNRSKAFFALILAVVVSLFEGMNFNIGTIYYSIGYGLLLAAANYTGLVALSLGNMAIASMLASFSLIVPCFYGMAFLGEKLSVCGAVGLGLVFVSIFMVSYKKKSGKLSAKFWIYSILTLIFNGFCSVLQKAHQSAYFGSYQSEFLIFANACVLIVFLLIKDKKPLEEEKLERESRNVFKNAGFYGAIGGVCNCVSNMFVLYLAASFDAVILFPVLSVLNSLLACVIGRVLFKEKLTVLQTLSVFVGITAVVLLRI